MHKYSKLDSFFNFNKTFRLWVCHCSHTYLAYSRMKLSIWSCGTLFYRNIWIPQESKALRDEYEVEQKGRRKKYKERWEEERNLSKLQQHTVLNWTANLRLAQDKRGVFVEPTLGLRCIARDWCGYGKASVDSQQTIKPETYSKR